MMNKPAGYVSANEDKRDPVVMELFCILTVVMDTQTYICDELE